MFRDPPRVDLLISEEFAHFEVLADRCGTGPPCWPLVYVSVADVKDAFYPLRMPPALSWYLASSRSALARSVSCPSSSNGAASPLGASCPMCSRTSGGLTWTIFFGQVVELWMQGWPRRSTSSKECGLVMRDSGMYDERLELLGLEVGCRRHRGSVSARHPWRMRRALEWLLRRGRGAQKTIEVILGHATFVGRVPLLPLRVSQGCQTCPRRSGPPHPHPRLPCASPCPPPALQPCAFRQCAPVFAL